MNKIINDYLFAVNKIERLQLTNKQFIFDYPNKSMETNNHQIKFLNKFFLNNKNIFINKHNRFADYPEHTHEFLELNYMYSGKSKQIINGNPELLTEGNILLIDKGSSHTINQLGQDDILINLIFKNKKMDLDWISSLMQNDGLHLDFLIDNFKSKTEKNYIIFKSDRNKHITDIMQKILEEYYLGKAPFNEEIIKMYIPILLTELIANCNYRRDSYNDPTDNELIIKLLKIIDINYSSITLEDAASYLGYNKNYLSNLIKSSTGKTFTQILLSIRMEKAKDLLLTTDFSINQIIQDIGLHNKTYFYDKFQEKYDCLPSKIRLNKKNSF